MNTFKIIVVSALVFLTGCASNASRYYDAVQKAAEAQERTYAARYEALTEIARKSGSVEATAAATMAIALSQPQRIQPQYIESSALKWAQILVPSAASFGSMYLQADLAKTTAQINRDVQMTSINANRDIQVNQQGVLQQTVLGVNEQTTGIATDVVEMIGTLGTQNVQTIENVITNMPDPIVVEPFPVEPLIVNQPEPIVIEPTIVNTGGF